MLNSTAIMKPFFLLTLILCFQLTLFAQTPPIKGRVLDDSTGAPIPDVTVILSGGNQGVSTGPDGSFTLPFPTDGRKHNLTISYTGYATQNIFPQRTGTHPGQRRR